MSRPRSASTSPEQDTAAKYEALLRHWPPTADEGALHTAYELGREMFTRGLGVLDVVALHNRAVVALLASSADARAAAVLVNTACKMLMESLAPFEMTHRGFREANVALRASEERYRELFENANDIIFTTDLAGHMASINHAGLVLFGYTREEALALNFETMVAPEHHELTRAMRHVNGDAGNRRARYELDVLTRAGERIPIEISTRFIFGDGRPVGIQGIARDVTDRKQAELALRHVNQWLEEKAKRIAHALHDEAGQLLASVYLRVAEIANELPPTRRRRLEDLRTLLDQVDDQIRRLAHELRPTILDDLGLVPACAFLAEGVSRRAKLRVVVRGSTGGRLAPDVETAIYRVTQEALTNASRHAAAQMITVEFTRTGNLLRGDITDDGVGFDLSVVTARLGYPGLGLMGMRERLAAIRGTLTIRSTPGEGTAIQFTVPVE